MDAPAYTVWDARYPDDRALVMCCCDTLEEAKACAPDYGIGAVVVEEATGLVVYRVEFREVPAARKRRK